MSFFIQGTMNQNAAGGPNACVTSDLSFIQVLVEAAGRITINSRVIDNITESGRDLYNIIQGNQANQGLELNQVTKYANIIDLNMDTIFVGEATFNDAFIALQETFQRQIDNLQIDQAVGIILVSGGQAIGIYLSRNDILLFDSHSRRGENEINLGNSFVLKCDTLNILFAVLRTLYPEAIVCPHIEFGCQFDYLLTNPFNAPLINFEGNRINYPNNVQNGGKLSMKTKINDKYFKKYQKYKQKYLNLKLNKN